MAAMAPIGAPGESPSDTNERQKLSQANEVAWLQVAALAEEVNDLQKAADAYEHALKHNDRNVHALLQLASISRLQERFSDAVNYLQKVLDIDGSSGEVHGAIGHCYLTLSQRAEGVPAVLECLRLCYDAYHEASLHLGAFHDPNLWYGIGLLYERYGALIPAGPIQRECYQAAEEALRSVLQAAPQFEKKAEILYRYALRAHAEAAPRAHAEAACRMHHARHPRTSRARVDWARRVAWPVATPCRQTPRWASTLTGRRARASSPRRPKPLCAQARYDLQAPGAAAAGARVPAGDLRHAAAAALPGRRVVPHRLGAGDDGAARARVCQAGVRARLAPHADE